MSNFQFEKKKKRENLFCVRFSPLPSFSGCAT